MRHLPRRLPSGCTSRPARESRGYSVFPCNTDNSPTKEARYLEVLLRRRVEGIVIVPTAESAPHLRRLQRQRMTFVQLHRKVEGVEADVVRADSYGGARALTEQLLAAGWRRIAYVGGLLATSTGRDRLAGFRDALAGAGVTADPRLTRIGEYSQQTGYALVSELLRSGDRPQALVIGNSRLAIGALHALGEAGLRVAQDIAVAAFNDIAALEEYSPRMISAIQPAYEIGRLGIRRLFGRIADRELPAEDILLPNRIVVRATSGQSVGRLTPRR